MLFEKGVYPSPRYVYNLGFNHDADQYYIATDEVGLQVFNKNCQSDPAHFEYIGSYGNNVPPGVSQNRFADIEYGKNGLIYFSPVSWGSGVYVVDTKKTPELSDDSLLATNYPSGSPVPLVWNIDYDLTNDILYFSSYSNTYAYLTFGDTDVSNDQYLGTMLYGGGTGKSFLIGSDLFVANANQLISLGQLNVWGDETVVANWSATNNNIHSYLGNYFLLFNTATGLPTLSSAYVTYLGANLATTGDSIAGYYSLAGILSIIILSTTIQTKNKPGKFSPSLPLLE